MACVVGLFEECHNPEVLEDGWIIPCAVRFKFIEEEQVQKAPVGRGHKDPSEITDIVSTGRKRAAAIAPIMTGMRCEWAGLRWAGGGIQPIVGCAGNTLAQVKRNEDLPEGIDSRGELQHGPDKSTLNNTPGVNLHRICASCHHRWHEMNDPGYSGERPDAHLQWVPDVPYYAHDPLTKATSDEQALSEAWWGQTKRERGEYPVELPDAERLIEPPETGILTENPFQEPDFTPFTEQSGETL